MTLDVLDRVEGFVWLVYFSDEKSSTQCDLALEKTLQRLFLRRVN